jgi:hypothetical protein
MSIEQAIDELNFANELREFCDRYLAKVAALELEKLAITLSGDLSESLRYLPCQ